VPPEAAEAFRAAFSKGRHFNTRIRDRYRFNEIEP
jgi:KTSC domain